MENRETEYAVRYHEGTKHSEISVRTSTHRLDWENKPAPFKVYEGLPSVLLPRDFPVPKAGALESLSPAGTGGNGAVGVEELAALLFFSAGLTRKVRYGGEGEAFYFRAASATGALYPTELYVVSSDIRGLNAGVYHFDPLGFTLTRLREGDHRGALASSSDGSVGVAPVSMALTSLAWRNAWKYQARSYRHWFWDAGVMVANLLSVASAMGTEARVVEGFVDPEVNQLLGLRENKEAVVALIPLGEGAAKAGNNPRPWPIDPPTRPLSGSEIDYPEMWEIHKASFLHTSSEVRDWTGLNYSRRPDAPLRGTAVPLIHEGATQEPRAKLGDVILRRGSTRRFAPSPVRLSDLSEILTASKAALPFDFLTADESLIDVYFVANDVDGLPSGAYFFDSRAGLLRELKRGGFRSMSAYLCLEQSLFGSASVVFFLMTSMGDVLGAYGNRGYRAAQLEGGIRAGKIYLSAYALGLGASGSTFYDDAVTDFFSPHAAAKATMIAVGVGVPAYAARAGRVLPQLS